MNKEKIKKISVFVLYFIVTVVGLSSIGLWLPFMLDDYNNGTAHAETIKALPGNIITYALVIFLISFIDRIIDLFKKANKYVSHALEFLILTIILMVIGFFVYKSLWMLKFGYVNSSISNATFVTVLSLGIWIYVQVRKEEFNNYSTLGGAI